MSGLTVETTNVSEGWVQACAALLAQPGHEANHLVVRMSDPLPEEPQIRAAADALMIAGDHQEVDEVRNTIFPAELAADFPEPAELAEAYLEDYDTLKIFSPQGTYFGRLCAYPRPSGAPGPQLQNTVAKLREARAHDRWRARYELNLHAEHKDHSKRRNFFPCLSHLNFQLGGPDHGRLDCLALYRFQDLTLKGYGNLLGLAQLQEYVAAATEFEPGELTVVDGHAALTLGPATREPLKALITERVDRV